MSLTTDRETPCLREIDPATGQQLCYLVLSEEERAKGFVRPVHTTYRHVTCGWQTTMGIAIAETYARDPKFYGGTFCYGCGSHFALVKDVDEKPTRQFEWIVNGKPTGTFVGE